MFLARILVVLLFGYSLTGCYLWGDYRSLKRDVIALKALARATPSPTECRPPGVPQARICNYSLFVQHLEGEYYMGYVNKALVDAGADACEKIEKELQEYYTDFQCYKKQPDTYQYVWYGFKIVGNKPPTDGKAHDYFNIPNEGSLMLGTVQNIVGPGKQPVSTALPEDAIKPLK